MKQRTHGFDPRQTMQRSNFEIFHYYDRKISKVGIHHHDFYEVYFFLGSKTDYRVEGKIYHLEMGDLLLIGPMEFHQPVTETGEDNFERIVLWINKNYLESFSSNELSLARCFDTTLPGHTNFLRPSPTQRADITHRLGMLLREQDSKDFGSELYSSGVLLQFLVELNRIAIRSAHNNDQQESSPLVTQVLDYINEHYNEPLSLDSLARQFYVSKYHLSHEFSSIVGTSVYRYIMLKRLLIAKQMLSSGISPGTVCINCGFGDYANFFRAFKAQYGVSPRDCFGEK